MSAEEIIREINRNLDAFAYDFDYWDEEDDLPGYDDFKSILGDFKSVASRGGSDQGSEWWNVYYFEDHDIYIKINGYYSSYNGVSNLTAFEVEPQQVMVTIYKKK